MSWTGKWRSINLVLLVGAYGLEAAPGLGPVQAAPPKAISEEPPLVGQPEGFSGAVGRHFNVEARVDAKEVRAEEPVRFRLRISCVGSAKQPPTRPDLRRMAKLNALFQIEDRLSEDRVTNSATSPEWQFVYLLRPRSTAVTAVPPVKFVYYRPGIMPASKGYQTTYTQSIELSVQAREASSDSLTAVPERFYRLADGSQLLRRDRPPALPAPWVLGLLGVVPPALCGAWYLAWRRLYPDAAQAARRRRSLAARRALQALRAARSEDADARARQAAAAMTTYLCQRLDVPLADATPAQAGLHLRRLGLPESLSDRVVHVLRSCEAARFAANLLPTDQDLPALTENVILTLESETWVASQSR